MPGAHHCRDPLLTLARISRTRCVRSKTSPHRKPKRRANHLFVGMRAGSLAVFVLDPGRSKRVGKPPLAISPCCQSPGFGKSIGGIIYVTQLGKAVRKSLEIRLFLIVPSALPDLPIKIGTKLRPRRCIFADVAQRELVQGGSGQARRSPSWGASWAGTCIHARIVPQSPAKGKRPCEGRG